LGDDREASSQVGTTGIRCHSHILTRGNDAVIEINHIGVNDNRTGRGHQTIEVKSSSAGNNLIEACRTESRVDIDIESSIDSHSTQRSGAADNSGEGDITSAGSQIKGLSTIQGFIEDDVSSGCAGCDGGTSTDQHHFILESDVVTSTLAATCAASTANGRDCCALKIDELIGSGDKDCACLTTNVQYISCCIGIRSTVGGDVAINGDGGSASCIKIDVPASTGSRCIW